MRFTHDKIQQAAYEMMPVQQRLKNHMQFGLVICSHALNSSVENDDLFFVAVNQINRGGVDVLKDSSQKLMCSSLNLKAGKHHIRLSELSAAATCCRPVSNSLSLLRSLFTGKRSIELSDFSTALKLFEHGISFLDNDQRWSLYYNQSLDLFDAAVGTACALNDVETVRRLSEEVLANATCNNDKLSCLYAVVRSLRLAHKFVDSKKVGEYLAKMQCQMYSFEPLLLQIHVS